MKFSDRLDKAVNRALSKDAELNTLTESISPPTEPLLIDMSDQNQRKNGLAFSRGPHIGWDDYENGTDYQPPFYFKNDVPMGPPDDGGNEFSSQYGGVRPWSIDEMIQTVVEPGGLAEAAMRLPQAAFLQHYTDNLRNREAVDELKSLAAQQLAHKIHKDEARKDVKFSTFILRWLAEGMKTGVSGSYSKEHRNAQGIMNYWNRALTQAIDAVQNDHSVADIHDLVMYGGIDTSTRTHATRVGVDQIDPTPGPKNPWGDLADRIHGLGLFVAGMIASQDIGQMRIAKQAIKNFKAEVGEDFEEKRMKGVHFTSKLIQPTSSRDMGVKTQAFQVQGKDGGETEVGGVVQDTEATDRANKRDIVVKLVNMAAQQGGMFPPATSAQGAIKHIKQILSNPISVDDFTVETIETGGRPSYNLMSPMGEVVGTFDDPGEAEEAKNRVNPKEVIANDLIEFSEHIGRQYGEFEEELKADIEGLADALTSANPNNIRQAIEGLEATAQIANEEAANEMSGAGKSRKVRPIVSPLSVKQYRVMLRRYGIKNYPERGTDQDPEIINGEPSEWAKAGYPKMRPIDIAKAWASPGKEKAAKIGVNKAWKDAVAKLRQIAKASFGLDDVHFEGVQTPNQIIYEEIISALNLQSVLFFMED